MKPTLLFLFFCILGTGLTEVVTHVHQQVVTQKKAEVAKAKEFSLTHAPYDSLRGQIATMSGAVLWQSRIATQPAEIKKPQTIQQGEELRTGKDGKATVTFSNVSMILSPNSHVNFIQTLPTALVISQDQGTVTYDGTQPVSVLSLDVLSMLEKGKMTVIVATDKSGMTTSVLQGQVTEAYNDSDSVTTTMQVPEGKSFDFDKPTLTGLVR